MKYTVIVKQPHIYQHVEAKSKSEAENIVLSSAWDNDINADVTAYREKKTDITSFELGGE